MAKNMIKKKQRIAHINMSEDNEMLSEGNDLLFGIFEEMKKNSDLTTVYLNSCGDNLLETNKIFPQQKTQKNINPVPSKNHVGVSKFKTIGHSRKFPLMEKCTRALKQIKHNRQLPKPRAHLAMLPNSPKTKARLAMSPKQKAHLIRSNSPSLNKLVSNVRSLKEQAKIEKKNSSKSQIKKSSEELKNKKASASQTKIEKSFTEHRKKSKSCELDTVKTKSVEENSITISNNLNEAAAESSSDSDQYEKFIQKVRPKKCKKKKDNSKNLQKSSKKIIKKFTAKCLSSESDYDMTDDETNASSKTNNKISKKQKRNRESIDNGQCNTSKRNNVSKSKKVKKKQNSRALSESDSDFSDRSFKTCYRRNKKVKRSHKGMDYKQSTSAEVCESEMDIVNDETYHDSSSESDLPSLSEIVQTSHSDNAHDSQFSEQSSVHNPSLECNSSLKTTSKTSLFSNTLNQALPHKASDIASVLSNDNINVSNDISGIASLPANEIEPVLHKKTSEINLSVGRYQHNIAKTPVTPLLVSSAQQSASCMMSDISSLESSDKLNKACFAAKKVSVLNNSSQEHFSQSTIVDLIESDNECENSFTVMPKIIMTCGQNLNKCPSHSEESDIELVDVIINELPKEGIKKRSNKKGSPNDNTKELSIKTEKVELTASCSSAKTQNIPGSKTSSTDKYEVAYSTGICQGSVKKTLSKENILKQSDLNGEPENSKVINSKNSPILSFNVKEEPLDDCEIIFDAVPASGSKQKLQNCNNLNIKTEKDSTTVKEVKPVLSVKNSSFVTEQTNQSLVHNLGNSLMSVKDVKKEPCDDDCEIVLDIASNSNSNLPGAQICNNSNVKMERNSKAIKQVTPVHVARDSSIATKPKNKLSQKEQKLHEVACSNIGKSMEFRNKNSELFGKEGSIDSNTMSIKALLQDLKKEFATYQDIIQTEQSVENTFKLLERSQAEKLMSLKSKITQCLDTAPDCNSVKNAVNRLLDSSELSSSFLKDTSKVPPVSHTIASMSDISVQDLKTFATINLVPLSSISEIDIKPNLAKLQSALKEEAGASEELTSVSFNEKCIVCSKDASAACQQCAKVFFCSDVCGKKYWEAGHEKACAK